MSWPTVCWLAWTVPDLLNKALIALILMMFLLVLRFGVMRFGVRTRIVHRLAKGMRKASPAPYGESLALAWPLPL